MKDEAKRSLQNITIALPEIYCDNLKKLQEMGIISSRSDGIRRAIQQFLDKEIENLSLLGFEPAEDSSDEIEDDS